MGVLFNEEEVTFPSMSPQDSQDEDYHHRQEEAEEEGTTTPQTTLSGGEAMMGEAWCEALSFVLSSFNDWLTIRAVSRDFRAISTDPSIFAGSSMVLETEDLEHPLIEVFLPLLRWAGRIVGSFPNAQIRRKREAAQLCLTSLAKDCTDATNICIRDWSMFERHGLPTLHLGFSNLRHLEIIGCDCITYYDRLIPCLKSHPQLLSLRATFAPKAVAGLDFVEALPTTLMALGFVAFEGPEPLKALLQRCPLEHLWFAATARFGPGMVAALQAEGRQLRTLSVPSPVSEETVYSIVQPNERLELLCRMRVGVPAFGEGPLSEDYEVMPNSGGTALRRIGSNAQLAANSALWAPPLVRSKQEELTSSGCRRSQAQAQAQRQEPDRQAASSNVEAAAAARAARIWATRAAWGEKPVQVSPELLRRMAAQLQESRAQRLQQLQRGRP
mmetsp:Transcript_10437/g.22988  ORF Transcript_10437/g.22988 Transcript_10437/m.22988 type:complete len:443 (-) Transcript_10437:76-1404(-)